MTIDEVLAAARVRAVVDAAHDRAVVDAAHDRAVVDAAHDRAAALAARDAVALTGLMHPDLRWTTFDGRVLDRDAYVASNTAGDLTWISQTLDDVDVAVVDGRVAILTARVTDEVERAGAKATFTLRLTQTWLRDDPEGWRCLSGHAGPRL